MQIQPILGYFGAIWGYISHPAPPFTYPGSVPGTGLKEKESKNLLGCPPLPAPNFENWQNLSLNESSLAFIFI